MITGILLAAGKSSRFGSQKLLARLPNTGGQRVIEVSAAKLLAAVGRVIAITSPDDLLMRVLDDCGCQVVINERAADGMGTSIAAGVNTSMDAEGWIIALGDMPYVHVETIALVRRYLSEQSRIVVPMYQGKRGHPVGFARQYGSMLGTLQGDAGARSIVDAARAENASNVFQFNIDDAGVIADIDVPADLQ